MVASVAAGPPRDLAMDAYRAGALLLVVLGHWLITVTSWSPDGTLHATNLLEARPWTQWATWVVQPVPLFFVIGGWASARSWRAASTRVAPSRDARAGIETWRVATAGAGAWRVSRLQRLLVPLRTFVLVGLVGGVVLSALAGAGGAQAARLLGMPLWFLAVYLPVTLATPQLVTAADRWGWRLPMGLFAGAAAVDAVRFLGGISAAGWVNFAFVWLGLAALGVVAERRPVTAHAARLAAVAALSALVAAVAWHWYPVSMVGVGDRSNNTPPTVALAMLGIAHAALASLAAPRLRSALDRRRGARRTVTTLGALGMHLYLWHLCATVAVVGLQRLGVLNVAPLSGRWWLLRPVWVLALAAVAVPLAMVAARADLRRLERIPGATPGHRQRWLVPGLLATAGLTELALVGFRSGLAATLAVSAIALATFLATRPARSPRDLVVAPTPASAPTPPATRPAVAPVATADIPVATVSANEGNPPWLRGATAGMVEP